MSEKVSKSQAVERTSPLIPIREILTLDLRSLALFRIGLGVLLILDWLDRIPDLRAHYSDEGIVPRFALQGIGPISIQVFSGEAWFQAVLAGIALVLAGVLIVGYRTLLVLFLSWLLLLGAHGRNNGVIQGGDMLLRLLMFWGLFLPLGACWSVDGSDPRSRPKGSSLLSPATVAYIIQICLVYLFASAWKWDPVWRIDGTAVHQALSVECFTTRFGMWLRDQTEVCRLLTYSTLWIEALGPAVLFLPFSVSWQRLFVITTFILFHVGLAITLELGNFPWVCCVAWLALLPGSFWDRIANQVRPPRLEDWTIWVDRRYPRARRVLGILQTFFWLGPAKFVEVEGKQHTPPWGVTDPTGQAYLGQEALIQLGKLSPWALPLEWLASTSMGRWLAGRIAGPIQIPSLPQPDPLPSWSPSGGPLTHVIIFLTVIYILLWNIRMFDQENNEAYLPGPVMQLGWTLGLDQGWGLFAPRPGRMSGWHIMVGTCKDGSKVDLISGGPVDRARPELISAIYPNGRWRKLITNLSFQGSEYLLMGYSQYLYREWNRTHFGSQQVASVEIIYMRELVMPPGEPLAPPTEISLITYTPPEQD